MAIRKKVGSEGSGKKPPRRPSKPVLPGSK